jgi:hypothetical protein
MPSDPTWVWVFGSNLLGRHGKGAALVAWQQYGAALAVGTGPTGKSYAIPTKDQNLQPRSLDEIRASVAAFIQYAQQNPQAKFWVTRVGCGLANFKDEQIAPMFASAPQNCSFAEEWRPYLEPPIVLIVFDKNGDLSFGVGESHYPLEVLVVDERTPSDRVYEVTHRFNPQRLRTYAGPRSLWGSAKDGSEEDEFARSLTGPRLVYDASKH